MREIKFRGKWGDNGEWAYGELICGVFDGNSFIDGIVIPETVGQFTGLTDKNGVEIYEGDILRNVDNPFVDELPFEVVWSNHLGAWFWWELGGAGTDHLYQSIAEDCEVIGNIHDNPELMEEKMNSEKLQELETIHSDLQGNMELIIRTDDGEFNWEYGRELLEELLDAEIERLSVTDDTLDGYHTFNERIESKQKESVRKSRTTEPCEWCEGNVSKYFDVNWYDFTEGNTGARPKAKFCPLCGREIKE